jgi:hypothetical protein
MGMERHHSDILTSRLETVMDEGCAHVLFSELYRWYGRQKLAARTWRDLEERWQEISEGELGPLYRIKVKGARGFFLLAGGDRIVLISDEAGEE